MFHGIKEILIITKNEDSNSFKNLLGNGKKYGINIEYAIGYRFGGSCFRGNDD